MWQEVIVGIIILIVFILVARYIFRMFVPSKRDGCASGCSGCAVSDLCGKPKKEATRP